jgi:ADP-ribosylglycohydrolase
MTKTSMSNPLYFDEVETPGSHGVIGMTICPGKKKGHGFSGDHDRELGIDLTAIQAWGAEVLVSLIEEHEYGEVGIADIGSRIPAEMLHLKLPIRDMGIPDANWEQQWVNHGRVVRAVLRRGGKVCIHCMGGLGRTGIVASRLLVEFGVHPTEAVKAVRKARPGTIQTGEQETYVHSLEPIWRRFDLTKACLLAGACGDALGATVEFIDRKQILAEFGPEGIRDFSDNNYGTAGKITDDTQMSLFTAEGLIRAEVRGRIRGLSTFEGCIHHAYLRWLDTQGCKVPVQNYKPDGWLIGNKELRHSRAPGNTCLRALMAAEAFGIPEKADNMSKGCGGVMRAAPVGLFMAARQGSRDDSRRLSFEVGCASAHLTHGHPSGYLSAGALSLIVHELILGFSLPEAIDLTITHLQDEKGAEETIGKLREAVRLAAGGEDPVACIGMLGEGWVGEEALAIAVFCALRARDLEDGICMAVNITGDSDSTGSIAGNLLGAMYGSNAIPPRWLESLELRQAITTVAEDLLFVHDSTLSTWDSLPHDPSGRLRLDYDLSMKETDWWCVRYPGW